MGLILDLSPRVLEKVLYFASYIVLDAGQTSLEYKQVLSEREYQDARETWGNKFRVGMGAEAIKELLQAIDLDRESEEFQRTETRQNYQKTGSCGSFSGIGQSAGMDDYGCSACHSSGSASYGSA